MERVRHAAFLEQALAAAESCREVDWYGVGCVIVDRRGQIAATGYTNELSDEDGKGRHAEDAAIVKAAAAGVDLRGAALYSTLEPCSRRASGKPSCVSKILETGIGTVVFGAKEPFDPDLQIVCEGARVLSEAGLEVVQLVEFEAKCLQSARRARKKP